MSFDYKFLKLAQKMKTTHTFEKAFGPAASFTGIVIFIAGLLAMFYSLNAIALVLVGAFMAFTNTSTTIDHEKKKVRFSNNIFGMIKIGKWMSLRDDMQIGTKQESNVYRTYSRSNQTIDLKVVYKKIYLFDRNRNPIFPIKQIKEKENVDEAIMEICKVLGVTRMS